ncbi:AAA family ATPase [Vibrio coralliirubri]|uniref:DnaB-like helicase C-terminal domain-containing protein n=1 Tax=Vibrio coralliirubri TaxID=1516159 RepID=UPI002284095C|nr:DnaB-like helicase C-terminal domain-containing protein [Vibrio coralliirubri]MCY9866142.1 AAA family ATPase [Vibrio coralliirubri]
MAISEEKTNYDLVADRRQCERLIAAFAFRYPELSERIPVDKLKNKPLRIICGQIKALYKQDGGVSSEMLMTHAVPRLVNHTFTEENCRAAVNELINTANSIGGEKELPRLVAHLQHLEAKDTILNMSLALTERVNDGDDVKKICSIGNQLVELGSRLKGTQKSVSVGDAFESLMSTITMAREVNADIGVPYPINSMMKALGTLYPSDLVVIAARPAVGKTALGLNFCRYTDQPMGFISSEMAIEQLAMRFVAMDAAIPANRIRDAKNLTEAEIQVISECMTRHKGRKLYIEDKGGINIGEIEDISEAWVNLHGIKVLIVDYAQRINSDRNHNSESEKIGHVTKRLKELAKRLGICVVLLAQINRDAVKGDRRPQTHDIKGSGDIEQEADVIILMHKPAMGTPEANGRCIVEMIVDKNRHGQVGLLVTEYDAERVTFQDPPAAVLEQYKNAD